MNSRSLDEIYNTEAVEKQSLPFDMLNTEFLFDVHEQKHLLQTLFIEIFCR